jgi:hypothetical protein
VLLTSCSAGTTLFVKSRVESVKIKTAIAHETRNPGGSQTIKARPLLRLSIRAFIIRTPCSVISRPKNDFHVGWLIAVIGHSHLTERYI